MNGDSSYGCVPKIKKTTLYAHEHTHSFANICYGISYCCVIRKPCDGIVTVVTWLWAGQSGVQFLGGPRDFSLLHSV